MRIATSSGITADARTADAIADLRARMALQERRTGTGSVTTSIAAGDTPTIELQLSGSTLTGLIPTTAAPQIATVGLATPATTEALTVGTFAGLRTLVDDHGLSFKAFHGDFVGPQGRWHLSQGTVASPFTTEQPTASFSRIQNITAPVNGTADTQWHSAVTTVARGNSGDKTAVSGLSCAGHQFSTTGTSEADSNGFWAFASHHGIGGAFAGYVEGRIAEDATSGIPGSGARCRGLEIRTCNAEATPTDSPYVATPYSSNKMNGLQMTVQIPSDNTKLAGSGFVFYRPTTGSYAQLDCGIACTADNTPIRNAFLRDDGAALYSLLINGTHTNAAISIAPSAGQFLCGVLSSGLAAKAVIKSGADGDVALNVQGFSATQSNSILYVAKSDNTEYFSVSQAGNTRVLNQLQLEGTAGNGTARFLEQSAPPGTPSSTRAYLWAEASGTSTVLKLKDDTGATPLILGGTSQMDKIGLGAASSSGRLTFVAGTSQADGIYFGTDTTVYRVGTGALKIDNSLRIGGTAGAGFIELDEQSANPSAPGAADRARIFVKDIGGSDSAAYFIDGASYVGRLANVKAKAATIWGTSPQNLSGGLDKVNPATTTLSFTAINVGNPCDITGLSFAPGLTAAGNVIMEIFDAEGTYIATTSSTAVTNTGGNVWQDLALVGGPIKLRAIGTYYVGVILSDITCTFRAFNFSGLTPSATGAAASHTVGNNITPSTTYTASQGPIVRTY